jgi:hypothetical protein
MFAIASAVFEDGARFSFQGTSCARLPVTNRVIDILASGDEDDTEQAFAQHRELLQMAFAADRHFRS